MVSIRTFLNHKIGALLLLALAMGLIYNPLTKFPFTFCVIIAFILLATYAQSQSLDELRFRKLSGADFLRILVCFVALEAVMDFVVQPIITLAFNEPADYSAFAALEGNTGKCLKYLIYMWISAAFGEELLFRAFAFAQLERIIGNRKAVIVVLSAVLFSLPHLYQGYAGLATTFVFGLAFGALFQSFKNIWINIIVHGLIDTLFLTLAYFGYLSFYA